MAGLIPMSTRGTHTHAASTEDEHIVLTLIKEGKTCCLGKTACVSVSADDLQRKLSDAVSRNFFFFPHIS